MKQYILSIDQGTTSTRAILFDTQGIPVAKYEIEITQIYPANGWVEHNPNEIWEATLACCRAITKIIPANQIAALGIANQRETTILWDRRTGAPLHNAIVWQDRRTSDRCHSLKEAGLEQSIAQETGLLLDPYFSATKAEWLLDHIPGSRTRAEKGELAIGTIDSYLIFKLTGGKVHATDVTNASRTLLMNLQSLKWSESLLKLFNIPFKLLPEIRNCADNFGETLEEYFGTSIPIRGVAGDQQSALIGQTCFSAGDVKSTYGTGCFMLVNTGETVTPSKNKLLSTCAYSIDHKKNYAIEGSIFVAGAVVQWLRDALGLIPSASEIESLATTAKPIDGLYFVPAFTGLGAPHWNPNARGAIFGLTRDTGTAEIAKAALDAVCYQTRDLLNAIARDMHDAKLGELRCIKVDGGMVKNNWFCQRLADLTGLSVERPKYTETTAVGAAYLAGLSTGIFNNISSLNSIWTLDRRFEPTMSRNQRESFYEGWQTAVNKTKTT